MTAASNANITGANINLNSNVFTTGNIKVGGYFVGDGSKLTNLPSASTLTGNLTVSGNILVGANGYVGIGTSNPDAELTILGYPQTALYSLLGNSNTLGTEIHISGADSSVTRITQDSFGANTYVAFTGRAARGTAASPSQTQSGDILSQFTGRGFSNGSLQFSTVSTGRVDVVAAENFTDTSRATKVLVFTTPTGSINPVNTATFDSTGAFTANGNVTTGAYFIGDGSRLTNLAAASTVTGNLNVSGNVVAGGSFISTGNQTGTLYSSANLVISTPANIVLQGNVFTTGNVYASYFNLQGNLTVTNAVSANTFIASGNQDGTISSTSNIGISSTAYISLSANTVTLTSAYNANAVLSSGANIVLMASSGNSVVISNSTLRFASLNTANLNNNLAPGDTVYNIGSNVLSYRNSSNAWVEVGYANIPQNSQNTNYTLVRDDSGKHIFHPATDTNPRTYTIPSNSNVAYPIGTAISFINMSANTVSIAIAVDTMYLSPSGNTSVRSLTTWGTATAVKITSNSWIISGSGLT